MSALSTKDLMFQEWWPVGLAAISAALLMPLAIRARTIGRDLVDGVQRLHQAPTSRLGGCYVFIAYLIALVAGSYFDQRVLERAIPLLLCSLPVVLLGAWEDITGKVRPRYRLAGALGSAMLATWYAGGIVTRLDLPIVDGWLAYAGFMLPLTWFMTAGACNAVNLIDGTHGLAGGTTQMMFAGLAIAAALAGDLSVAAQSLVLMGAIFGFLVWNYPHGKVFLGDAGAYFLGFMYAELSMQLIARNASISAWFVIALAAYPIVETAYSIYRRKVLRVPSMAADAAHLHSLVFRRLARAEGVAHDGPAINRTNARVALSLWLHAAICLVAAVLLRGSATALIGFTLCYAGFYVACYRRVAHFDVKPAANL